MCTVSWATEKGGYRLLFNRDEQRSRAEGEAPSVWDVGEGRAFLGPRDPAGGGSWIGVNHLGWTSALLNHYERAGRLPPGRRSRGEIVRAVAPCETDEELAPVLAAFDWSDFAPFHLLRVSPAGVGWLATWDGGHFTHRELSAQDLPLTSSSVETSRVVERRRTIFRALTAGGAASAESLAAFHRHYDHTDGAASVCMRREDALTVSLSDIQVGKRGIVFRYFRRDPDNGGFLRPEEFRWSRS